MRHNFGWKTWGGERSKNKHMWKDNIKTYVEEMGPEIVDGIQLAQDTYQWHTAVNMAINI